jgi:arylformamidase
MKNQTLAIVISLAASLTVGCSNVLAQDASDTIGGQSQSMSTGTGAGMGQGRGRWQSLSPEERKEKLTKFMQMRAGGARGGAMAGGGAGSGGAGQVQHVAPQGNYDLHADLAYGTAPLQKIDVYSPKNASGAPILFFVHGGGWSKGDKASKDNAGKGASYTAQGVVLVSVNYGLAPETMHPKQIEDIASAFAYVKEHATEFGGDPKKIYLMGHSAGAQLVDLLATNDKYLTAKGASLSDIRGVVSLDTASLDLNTRIGDDSFEGGMVGNMITTAFGKDPAQLTDGSPTLNIKPGKKYPPFLMYCGSTRKTCCAQHDVFAAALKKVGGSVTVQRIPLSHRDINMHSGDSDAEIFKAVLQMLKS